MVIENEKTMKYISRSSHGRCSVKQGVLKNFKLSQGSTCVGVSL